MPGPLGFSGLPVELKPISAYVQRADELKTSEPVVAYWCTYYAAQQGIALGAKGVPARTFLGELLGTLENMKANISDHDADAKEIIESDAASAAYLEGFALKVFNSADNEDRLGKATRCVFGCVVSLYSF
jgi:vacuolar protein sorting-associated protein VTA1